MIELVRDDVQQKIALVDFHLNMWTWWYLDEDDYVVRLSEGKDKPILGEILIDGEYSKRHWTSWYTKIISELFEKGSISKEKYSKLMFKVDPQFKLKNVSDELVWDSQKFRESLEKVSDNFDTNSVIDFINYAESTIESLAEGNTVDSSIIFNNYKLLKQPTDLFTNYLSYLVKHQKNSLVMQDMRFWKSKGVTAVKNRIKEKSLVLIELQGVEKNIDIEILRWVLEALAESSKNTRTKVIIISKLNYKDLVKEDKEFFEYYIGKFFDLQQISYAK